MAAAPWLLEQFARAMLQLVALCFVLHSFTIADHTSFDASIRLHFILMNITDTDLEIVFG